MKILLKRGNNGTKKSLNFTLEHSPLKYILRSDLTPEIRFSIALQAYFAQVSKKYGKITTLAREHQVCRQFIYNLIHTIKSVEPHLFAPVQKISALAKKEIISLMLSFRMEGGSSIQAISTMMQRVGVEKYNSVGYISETLKEIGSLLPTTLHSTQTLKIVIASDEIFASSQAILIDVEPISSAIIKIELADNRTGETWSNHYNEIDANNIEIKKVVSDGGTGLLSGLKKSRIFAGWQPDTYHAIAHHFGGFVDKFKSQAYNAIENEYRKEASVLKAKTEESFEKNYHKYIEACQATITTIELYENFKFLYRSIIKELLVFSENGELRDRIEAQENIKAGLLLLESLQHETISNEVKSVQKILPNLLNYFEQAQESVKTCNRFGENTKALKTLYLLWQAEKSFIKQKNRYKKQRAKQHKERLLQEAKYLLGKEFEIIKEKVFEELNNIIQASSMVETINSILRPYLNHSKNQVTQEFLNLFAFYHNHRVYNDGKRKGKSPMEILTKQKPEKNWIELLIDIIEEKEPLFFL